MRRTVIAVAVLVSALFLPGRSGEARANLHDDLELLGLLPRPAGRVRGVYPPQATRLVLDAPQHARGWRPYSVGQWVITDYDGTWVSDEPWGWATDHYGRWFFEPSDGWVWVRRRGRAVRELWRRPRGDRACVGPTAGGRSVRRGRPLP
jgi:uncharacterized protein DUF6600